MIIRLAQNDDISGIVSLWNEAFGDSFDEIMFFINNKFVAENTLVAVENDEIASVLFLLDGKMQIKCVDYPSYYLYAACTLKKYRGRGYMALMLEDAKNLAFSRHIDFICLMPGEKSLFDFYSKFGYKSVFSKKVLKINTESVVEAESLHSCDVYNTEKLRNNAFEKYDYFKWDSDSIKFAFSHNKMYHGKQFCDCNGYFLYSTNSGVMSVKEFAFTDIKSFEKAVKIAQNNNCSKIIINLPFGFTTEIGNYEIVPSAMMLNVSERSESLSDGLQNAYLGLTLD